MPYLLLLAGSTAYVGTPVTVIDIWLFGLLACPRHGVTDGDLYVSSAI